MLTLLSRVNMVLEKNGGEPYANEIFTEEMKVKQTDDHYPPLKVRKEKLGDRISALQQMVAPFGKVPTCSQEWSLSSAPDTLASLSTFSFELSIRTF
ncbi:hypothetical protein L6452_18336 [Arctium lappa]|uniref:Uncharacterized protein n=1 Tax=Arctium lappa TaxID=4217 RepID=A0ACB9C619_ARCLA|nr:hypothetical protein L6452_18336 [Arctium lappa]